MSPSRTDERGWKQTRDRLHEVLQKAPLEGVSRWSATYAEALLTGDLETCDRLVTERFHLPTAFAELVETRFRAATEASRAGRVRDALGILTAGAGDSGRDLSAIINAAPLDTKDQSDLRGREGHTPRTWRSLEAARPCRGSTGPGTARAPSDRRSCARTTRLQDANR